MINEPDDIKTDNIPLLDGLIYNIKKIVNSIVVKEQNEADKYETSGIEKEADEYIDAIEDRKKYYDYNYYLEDFISAGVPLKDVSTYLMADQSEKVKKLPEDIKQKLFKNKKESIIKFYAESNKYYRDLEGKPSYDGSTNIYVRQQDIPDRLKSIKADKNIDMFTKNEIDVLYGCGFMDTLYNTYGYEYLKHMGSKSISPYVARKADDADLLYIDSGIPDVVLNRFKEKYVLNKAFIMKTVYSNAFKLESRYYDNFIRAFILINTIIDMIDEIPDMIIKREVFDVRMVKVIMVNSGVEYFPEIPLRYQLALVRNLNRLIKYKSTTRNIVDICSLFGFDNIEVFKYYILKIRNVDSNGRYISATKEQYDFNDNKWETVEDLDKEYSLKFLKVPIDNIADNYLSNQSNYLDYDQVAAEDKYWNGDVDPKTVKDTILKHEFNILNSKYLSVDTIYSLDNLTFEQAYFVNMLFDDEIKEEDLMLPVPLINSYSKFRLTDLFNFLFALAYEYLETNDMLSNMEYGDDSGDYIMDLDKEKERIAGKNYIIKTLYVRGFNFKADLTALGNYIAEKGFTAEELGIDKFQIPDKSVLTFNQLVEVFANNTKIYNHIRKQLENADNKNIYEIYKKIYDTLFLTELTLNYYRKPDGTLYKSFTEFLKDRDGILYEVLLSLEDIDDANTKKEQIIKIIDAVVYQIELQLEDLNFKYLFNNLPGISVEYIKEYMKKVINFFKSFKVDFLSINTIYLFDDKLDNLIKMIDEVSLYTYLTKQSTVEILDKADSMISKLTYNENIPMKEKAYIYASYIKDLYMKQYIHHKEDITLNSIHEFKSSICIDDNISITVINE